MLIISKLHKTVDWAILLMLHSKNCPPILMPVKLLLTEVLQYVLYYRQNVAVILTACVAILFSAFCK